MVQSPPIISREILPERSDFSTSFRFSKILASAYLLIPLSLAIMLKSFAPITELFQTHVTYIVVTLIVPTLIVPFTVSAIRIIGNIAGYLLLRTLVGSTIMSVQQAADHAFRFLSNVIFILRWLESQLGSQQISVQHSLVPVAIHQIHRRQFIINSKRQYQTRTPLNLTSHTNSDLSPLTIK